MTIIQASVSKEITNDYVGYAISTAGRAIPSVQDGLKVSHRRILQIALEGNYTSWVKTARLSGEVMGKLSPHGSCGGTIQGLANVSSYLNPLMLLHGNCGSYSLTTRQVISQDNAASERYTESKLSEFAKAVFDIDKKYLKTRDSYDGSMQEVVEYIPSLPLALINGQSGIGTGYAVNSAGYVASDIIKILEGKKSFSNTYFDQAHNTNIISNKEELDRLNAEGRGSFKLQGEWTIESYNTGGKRNANREALVITKIASANAETLCEQIKSAVNDGKIEGISNVIDETSQDIRVIVVCKNDVKAESLISPLLRYTCLQSTLSLKYTLINNSLPKEFTPSEILSIWLEARRKVLITKYSDELAQAQNTLLLKEGLYKVFPNLKNIALLIMEAETVDEARLSISNKYKCSNEVAESILQIQLKKLTKLSKSQLELEIQSLKEQVVELQKLTTDAEYLHAKIIELAKLAAKYCCSRVSPVIPERPTVFIEPIIKDNISKVKTRHPGNISTAAYNKAKKKYFDKVGYIYCKNINELNQALEDGRHEMEDVLIKDAIRKSEVKKKSGKLCKPLTERDILKAMKNGILSSARLKEHVEYWQNR